MGASRADADGGALAQTTTRIANDDVVVSVPQRDTSLETERDVVMAAERVEDGSRSASRVVGARLVGVEREGPTGRVVASGRVVLECFRSVAGVGPPVRIATERVLAG